MHTALLAVIGIAALIAAAVAGATIATLVLTAFDWITRDNW